MNLNSSVCCKQHLILIYLVIWRKSLKQEKGKNQLEKEKKEKSQLRKELFKQLFWNVVCIGTSLCSDPRKIHLHTHMDIVRKATHWLFPLNVSVRGKSSPNCDLLEHLWLGPPPMSFFFPSNPPVLFMDKKILEETNNKVAKTRDIINKLAWSLPVITIISLL